MWLFGYVSDNASKKLNLINKFKFEIIDKNIVCRASFHPIIDN
jgi:hypothetical protein